MSKPCTGCGAHLAEGVVQCDLCGTPVDGSDSARIYPAAASIESAPAGAPATPVGAGRSSVYCNQCGWENPAVARYCSQCGAAVQVAPVPQRTPASEPTVKSEAAKAFAPVEASGAVGRRVGMIFGLALIVIVAIFLIDAASSGPEPTQDSTDPPGLTSMPTADAPLPAEVASQVDALTGEASSLSGEAKLTKLREIVDLLSSVGRFDRAAVQQEAIAEQTGTEADWIRTGNLYYDWMDVHDGVERATFAKSAIAAYRKVLEVNPDNLDVRTDMAVAYMSDPDNPMLAIQENAAVLAVDSLHVQANFNRGIMLLQIGRVEGAIAQFEKVQRLVGNPADPMHILAEQALLSVRQESGAPPPPAQ